MDQIEDKTNKCRFVDDETVRRLIANDNDPTIAGVRIVLGDDILAEMDHGSQDDNDDDYIDFYDPTYDYISNLVCFEARRVGRAIKEFAEVVCFNAEWLSSCTARLLQRACQQSVH
jgi:hypothetical protein